MENNEKDRAGFGDPGEKLILIVEDDDSVWDLFYYIVRREGFKTEKASDGKEALDKARILHPQLILLDMMLPKLGGYEIVRELQDDATSDIPIVLASSRSMDHSTLEMLKREPNVKEFLEKPVNTQVLISLLHSLLKTRPPAREEKKEP